VVELHGHREPRGVANGHGKRGRSTGPLLQELRHFCSIRAFPLCHGPHRLNSRVHEVLEAFLVSWSHVVHKACTYEGLTATGSSDEEIGQAATMGENLQIGSEHHLGIAQDREHSRCCCMLIFQVCDLGRLLHACLNSAFRH